MKKSSNYGFSYVEMIIVLAILAIMAAFISISIGTNRRNEVNRTSDKLESLVNQARTSAMTKGTERGKLNIAFCDGAYYAYVGEAKGSDVAIKDAGEKIASGNVMITIAGNIDASSPTRCLTFMQNTGGLQGSGGGVYLTDMHVMVSKDLKSAGFSIDGVTGKIKH